MPSSSSALRRGLPALVVSLVLGCVFAGEASALAGASRTWVSGVGDDANPCSRTAPCKTLAGAIGKTQDGGEINAIDPGGFGAVTITRPVTIDLRNVLGGVLNSGATGVVINAPDADIVLRGVVISGGEPGVVPVGCPYLGVRGVRIISARSVVIEDSTISVQQTGVVVESGGSQVLINRTTIANTCTNALAVIPGGGGTSKVLVRDSVITNAATAIHAADGGSVWLTGSTIFGNATAFQATGTGAINAYSDNRILGNEAGETPTAVVPSLAPPTPAPTPTPAATPTPTPAPTPAAAPTTAAPAPTPIIVNKAAVCTVPRLIGKSRAAAAKSLADAGCTLGAVTTRRGSAARAGKVVAQKRSAGSQLAVDSPVAITLGTKR